MSMRKFPYASFFIYRMFVVPSNWINRSTYISHFILLKFVYIYIIKIFHTIRILFTY